MKSMESHKNWLSTLPSPLGNPCGGFPHYHGYGDDYYVSEDRQSPPKTRHQSHFRRKGLVNHVPGLKRKGCPGTLTPLSRCVRTLVVGVTLEMDPGIWRF